MARICRVLVENGVVTLTGNTNTFHERSHAQSVASAVPGVREVVDAVSVNLAQRYTDDRLKAHIEDRLASHDATHVAAYDIKVSVDNGTATLTGNVHDWYERKEAGRIAFLTDGVLGLHNELTVEGYAYPWDEWLMPTIKYYDSLYDMYPTLG